MRIHKMALPFLIISLVFMLTACGTTPTNLVRAGVVNVEYESSRDLHFSHVAIYRRDTGVLIAGELHKRANARGSIPGHIDIEIIGPDGAILATKCINYHRGSLKSRRSQFSIEIPIDLPINSTVRIMHNDALLRDCPKSSLKTPITSNKELM